MDDIDDLFDESFVMDGEDGSQIVLDAETERLVVVQCDRLGIFA